ncbi:hypothetical protein Hypma_012135 [Hypsizygus marmoreus]|uniref:Uncharacterized protein n=1 Tax=Hypsizygus marmoreus TaxID=39966 RepID=A0A369JEP9_HYPMA|nr:hypothetical protein Hypma_012135 [Hypsizygus marmoreus]
MDVPIRPTMSLICSIIQASAQSAETVVFKGMFDYSRGHQNWFTFDFKTSPTFNCLAFHIIVSYHSRNITGLCQLLDFMSANPSTAGVPVFRIVFVVPYVVAFDLTRKNTEGFAGLHDMIAESAVWAQLDYILHSARHLPSAAHRVEIVLQTLDEELTTTAVALSLDEIRKQMPLTSTDGILVCHHYLSVDGDIYEVL